MSDNPYSSPAQPPVGEQRKSSAVCTVMFWLSCILSLTMLAIALNGGYQYWLYSSQAGMKLPESILVESVGIGFSGLGMLFSAMGWRRQAVRWGAGLFGCSLLAFVWFQL